MIILDNFLSIFTLYIFKFINIAIKQLFKLCISVLGVYILPLEWPCKIPEEYKAPRLCRRVYYSENNGVPAVTRTPAYPSLYYAGTNLH